MKKIILLFVLFFFEVDISFTQELNTLIVDSLLNKLWHCDNNFQKSRIIKKIEKLNPEYDDLFYSIKNKIKFSNSVEKGFVEWEYNVDSIKHYCIVLVPNNYNPLKKYSVSVCLHGAIMNLDPLYVKRYITPQTYNLDSLDRIFIYPVSWIQSLWWSNRQVDNLKYILKRLKQNYNIDDNNIHLVGISDGATGIYYQANMNCTPWASFRPYIGSPQTAADLGKHEIYLKNFNTVSFLIVNTSHDKLFPASEITPYIDQMKLNGSNVKYFVMNEYGHDLNWLPLLNDTIQSFMKSNVRNPYPSEIFWRTDNCKKYGRNRWVCINKLKKNGNSTQNIENSGVIVPVNQNNIVLSGSIYVKQIENSIYVKTYNVKEYTLLISPEQFDFNKPICVYTNGNLSFNGVLNKSSKVLLKWLSNDIDRLMLFGNELNIKIP